MHDPRIEVVDDDIPAANPIERDVGDEGRVDVLSAFHLGQEGIVYLVLI